MSAEVGPIRPPSEARSLLIRLSRNCPWNRCLFCPVYKHASFSIRKKSEIIEEINFLAEIDRKIERYITNKSLYELSLSLNRFFEEEEIADARRLLHWRYHGEFNIFLQDADPLFRKKSELIEIINHIKRVFPKTKRITAYGRASTIDRYSIDELSELKNAGLSRIHSGLESGSQQVLDMVCKGIKVEEIVSSGQKLKKAGIEYCLYFMPGLGGKRYSAEHVEETIKVINNAQPAFVRLRTLGLNESIPLFDLVKKGDFEVQSETELVEEIKRLIEGIKIETYIASDHNLNLLMDIEGSLPEDREKLIKKLEKFLNLPEDIRLSFILARRTGKVFELHEFLSFSDSLQIGEELSCLSKLSDQEKNMLFLKLRSENL